MRGPDQQQSHIFSYISPEGAQDHPLRPIRAMVDEVLKELSTEFTKMYAKVGRPSIPPEQLLRAPLLQMLYSVRSERLHLGLQQPVAVLGKSGRGPHFVVHIRITLRFVRFVRALLSLHAGPRFQQRSVHREVFVREPILTKVLYVHTEMISLELTA